MNPIHLAKLCAVGVLGAVAACGSTESGRATGDESAAVANPAPRPKPLTAPPAAAPLFAGCDEAGVIAIANAASRAEVLVANAVVNDVTDEDVRAFAKQMIDDHSNAPSALSKLNSNRDVEATGNGIAKTVLESARLEAQGLGAKSGDELARAYIDHEVIAHIEAKAMFEQMLLPNARNPDLQKAIQSSVEAVGKHLRKAIALQERLEGKCGGTVQATGQIKQEGAKPAPRPGK